MRRPLARVLGVILVASTALGVAAGSATAKSSKSTSTPKLAAATLNASGSTFQLAFDQVVIGAFRQLQHGVTINYAGGGSGKGRQDFSDQVVDWAGTDGVYAPADAAKVKGGPFFYFPTVAAPITVSYNLPSVKKLQLSPDTIAKIFERQINTWDNSAIQADNPGVKLPSTPITVAHRSDGSGTTQQFTLWLTMAAPSTWTLGSGSTVSWPADTQGGNGNLGVAQIVKGTEGTIGYVDYSDAKANDLTFASVKNKSAKFIAPSLSAASAALAGVTVNQDLTYVSVDSPAPAAYPITAPTWILVYKNQTDKNKAAAIVGFLNFVYGNGQKLAPTVDYAPLPKSMLKLAKAQISQIVVPT